LLFLRRLVSTYGRKEELQHALSKTAQVKKREAELAAEERETAGTGTFQAVHIHRNHASDPNLYYGGCRNRAIGQGAARARDRDVEVRTVAVELTSASR
jgi:hypothetical protein